MEQLRQMIAGLTLRQKITILVAIAAVLSGLWWADRWNREQDMKPLLSGVAPEDAGAVLDKLRAQNVEYKVSDNGAVILVPSARVAELRLQMAAAGLPKTGRIGFELFDKTNFGASDFAQQINYRRALEGELERSVMSLTEVEKARVHVSFARDSIFTESRQPARASVMVKLRPAVQLPPGAVLAIQHLAASAVEGLAPESVSVLEMNGTLLSRPRPSGGGEEQAASAALDYRQSLEKDLRAKIRQTLDPVLGAERYRADVSVDCDITSGEQSEETFDPARSVMTSSSKTEDSSGNASPGGIPGTASNLPRPLPRAESSARSVARRSENIQYQTSRVVRKTRLPQGAVKHISVAVLVDQSVRWQGSGPKAQRILEPPPAEKLKVIRDLVAGIVGFQQERGDQILVESLPFEATLQSQPPETQAAPGTPGQGPGFAWPAWMAPWAGKIPVPVLFGVLLGLALAVVGLPALLLLRKRGKAPRAAPALEAAASAGALPPPRDPAEFEKRAIAQLAHVDAEQQRQEQEMLASFRTPGVTKKGEILKKHIADEAKKDPVAVAHLVRTWLSEQER